VISWFQTFAFKWVNLYRYAEADIDRSINELSRVAKPGGGLYKSNPVDP
jgi:ubiquinone/menaquinone biosynthesis C-methylase UbiE